MYLDNIRVLDAMSLSELENVLDEHTRKLVPVDEYTAFSWSASRHQMFAQCKRMYYLNYYAPRRVRHPANHPAVSAIWWLKQASSLRAWMGSIIHDLARDAILTTREGRAIDPQAFEKQAVKRLNGGIQASWRSRRFESRWVLLREHLYSDLYEGADWDGAESHLRRLVETLFNSDALQTILSLPHDKILEVDEPFQSMPFDGVKVFAIPDVVTREGNLCHIRDWKTGQTDTQAIQTQAGIYALYAHLRYGAPEEDIAVTVVDLGNDGANLEPAGGVPPLSSTEAFIRESMDAMVALMEDVQHNTVAIADYPMTPDFDTCHTCQFKRACWRHEAV